MKLQSWHSLGVGVVWVGLLLAGNANAVEWVAGGAIGQAKQYDYSVGGPIDNSDDTTTAYRAFGGLYFLPGVGATVSYVDLGEPDYDGPAFGGFTDKLQADGWDVSLVGRCAPGEQTRIQLFASAGVFIWKQDVHYVDTSGTYNYNDDGESLSYGGGVNLRLGDTSPWGFHVAYQMFQDVGDDNNSGHEYDRSLVEVGFNYSLHGNSARQ